MLENTPARIIRARLTRKLKRLDQSIFGLPPDDPRRSRLYRLRAKLYPYWEQSLVDVLAEDSGPKVVGRFRYK